MTSPQYSLENETSTARDQDGTTRQNIITAPRKLSGSEKLPVGVETRSLQLPVPLPIRPFSPDTLSILSYDEYDQLAPSSAPPHHSFITPKPSHGSSAVNRLPGWVQRFWLRNKGLVFLLIAQFFGVLMNITTRLLEVEGNNGKGMDPFQILSVRMFITCVLCMGYMWYHKTPNFPFGAKEVRWLLVARGMSGFFGVFGMYYSLLYLSLSDAVVITFLAPALACWACSILIKEPFTRAEQIGAGVSLVGVVLIARPTALFHLATSHSGPSAVGSADGMSSGNVTSAAIGTQSHLVASDYNNVTSAQRLGAVGVALLGVLGAAGAYTTIRWIGKRAHPLISVNYFATWCLIVSVAMMLVLPDVTFALPANAKEWSYLLFLGLCGFVMQFLMAAGLAHEKSSRATNMVYTQMLFALAGDKLVFGHTPGIMSIVGSSLILGSAIVVALQKSPVTSTTNENRGGAVDDPESQRGLLGWNNNDDSVALGEDHDRLSMEHVQLRTLR